MKDYRYLRPRVSIARKLSRSIVALGALCLIGLGSFGLWPWVNARVATTHPPDPKVTVTNSTDKPDERSIKVSPDNYQVPADQPRLLKFPQLGESAYIQRVGVDQDGRVAVPNNVSLAGWYVKSKKPGDAGLSIIDGHVAGHYRSGVFGRLGKMKKGDTIVVEYGDGSQRHFVVVDTQTVPEAKSSELLFKREPDLEAQLNLITCATYVPHTQTYTDRLIVIAKFVRS